MVFTKRPAVRGGRRPGVWYKHIWALLCRRQATKNLDPSPMAKNGHFFHVLGEDCRAPRATSGPLDHGSTWCLRGRHLHSLALPDTKRVGRGLILCRGRRSIVAWTVFDQRLDNFQRESTISSPPIQKIIKPNQTQPNQPKLCRRVQPREQIIYKNNLFSRFPSGGTRVSSADFFFWIVWKENLATSRLHCHRSDAQIFFDGVVTLRAMGYVLRVITPPFFLLLLWYR